MLINPLNSFPWVINGLVQAFVSLRRMQAFLNLENLNWLSYYSYNELEVNQSDVLVLRDGQFNWKKLDDTRHDSSTRNSDEAVAASLLTPNVERPALSNVNLTIKKGSLVGVLGKVGAGKTSLLHCLMGELEKLNGKIRIDPELCSNGFAYVGQETWIEGSSLKENILFGNEYDEVLYKRVIDACALTSDLEMLPRGDETAVGENGICLSGGQKARLTLARACYSLNTKEVFLLDDPLSAVDAHVAKHLFTSCISTLLANKTRILCTHHFKYLMSADLVIVLENGSIVQCGKGSDVIANYLAANNGESNFLPTQEDEKSSGERRSTMDHSSQEELTKSELIVKLIDEESIKKDEEEKEHGTIDVSIYKYYSRSIGVVFSILTILFLALMQSKFFLFLVRLRTIVVTYDDKFNLIFLFSSEQKFNRLLAILLDPTPQSQFNSFV
jgi:ATP-binding cassette subfamily C (CFTR/MRP) protein 10